MFLHYLGEKWTVKFPHVNKQYWFYFHKTFLFSMPTLHACVNAHGGQLEHLLWLSCTSYQVLLVFLALYLGLFNFLNFMLTVWTTAFIASVAWFVIRYRNSTYRSFWRILCGLYRTLEHKVTFSWYREQLWTSLPLGSIYRRVPLLDVCCWKIPMFHFRALYEVRRVSAWLPNFSTVYEIWWQELE